MQIVERGLWWRIDKRFLFRRDDFSLEETEIILPQIEKAYEKYGYLGETRWGSVYGCLLIEVGDNRFYVWIDSSSLGIKGVELPRDEQRNKIRTKDFEQIHCSMRRFGCSLN